MGNKKESYIDSREKGKKDEVSRLRRRVERFEGLLEFSRIINLSNNYKTIKKAAISKMKSLLGCETVMLYRFDDEHKNLATSYISKGKKKRSVIALDDTTATGYCARHSATLFIKDVSNDLRYRREMKENHLDVVPYEVILTPLFHEGRLFGVIKAMNCRHPDGFQEEDISFMESFANQLSIALQNIVLFDKYREMFFQIIEAFADAIGKKDSYTGGHTKRVSYFAEAIASEMTLSFEEMEDLRLAARLHDIGKIGIPDNILNKSAPLNDAEFKVMRDHPKIGFEILRHIKRLERVTTALKYHHERPDGKGYPYALKGQNISVLAQIISVADTFDAMISTRPYRKGLPPMVAYQEILDNSGTQFIDEVVQAFKRYFEKSSMFKPSRLRPLKKVG